MGVVYATCVSISLYFTAAKVRQLFGLAKYIFSSIRFYCLAPNIFFHYDREKLQERLAKLAGGVAVIYVGAASEVEMKKIAAPPEAA